MAADVAHQVGVVGNDLLSGFHSSRRIDVEILLPEPAVIAQLLNRQAVRADLLLGSHLRGKGDDRLTIANSADLAVNRVVVLAERDSLAVPFLVLNIDEHVVDEDAELSQIDLVEDRIEAKIDRLNLIDRICENALPVRRDVYEGVGDRRLNKREGRRFTSGGEVIDHAVNGYALTCLAIEENSLDVVAVRLANVQLHLIEHLAADCNTARERAFRNAVIVPRKRQNLLRLVSANLHLLRSQVEPQRPSASAEGEGILHKLLSVPEEVDALKVIGEPCVAGFVLA